MAAILGNESFWNHDDVIKWEHFPRYWPFVWGIHRSPVNSPHKGQWRGALMFSLICAWINGWVNNREAGDLGRHCAYYDVSVMFWDCRILCRKKRVCRLGKTLQTNDILQGFSLRLVSDGNAKIFVFCGQLVNGRRILSYGTNVTHFTNNIRTHNPDIIAVSDSLKVKIRAKTYSQYLKRSPVKWHPCLISSRSSDAWICVSKLDRHIIACSLLGPKPSSERILAYCQFRPWDQISVKF